MIEDPLHDLLTVSPADVAWACEVLGLPAAAFSGPDGTDPRLAVIRSSETLDVTAGPGSGKTTLLVAKLAVLARKWTPSHRGICILSHTNVARAEIETQLGSTAEGQRLLSYPHFIGTIHGFINEFLAMPWLRSLGIPVRYIDNGFCEQHRRRLLHLTRYASLAEYVVQKETRAQGRKNNIVQNWRISSPEFEVRKVNEEPEFKNPGPSASQLTRLARQCAEDGYHCFEEMFMWAHDLLNKRPEVKLTIRHRFPLLFLDEVQDNNEAQSAILHRLFMDGDNPVSRQRYGDPNQAIYGHAGEAGAVSDPFPIEDIRRDIPNSHRFGQQIADLAKPLGLAPQELVGLGPQLKQAATDTANKHAVFLFDDNTIARVIPAYADYLVQIFSRAELQRGDFRAVAAVHRPSDNSPLPRFIGHYWPHYDFELSASDPRPATFVQYVAAGQKHSEESGEAHHAVEKTAEALLRLARIIDPTADLVQRKHIHRHIVKRLETKANELAAYRELVSGVASGRIRFTKTSWQAGGPEAVLRLARALAGIDGALPPKSAAASAFLEWKEPNLPSSGVARVRDNVFRHPEHDPVVQIRLGSIHSIKGETHTATLVLDSYYKKHNLAALKPWLLGQSNGKGAEGLENQARLKQHYVAMTRPTHLLCLALREDAFLAEELALLKGRGWRVGRVNAAQCDWM